MAVAGVGKSTTLALGLGSRDWLGLDPPSATMLIMPMLHLRAPSAVLERERERFLSAGTGH